MPVSNRVRWGWKAALISVLAASIPLGVVATGGYAAEKPFTPGFPPGHELLTNEIAYFDPGSGAPQDPDWLVTSGSLFADAGTGWTGPVDAVTPDPQSRRHTNSAVFRLITRRADFRDVTVAFDVDVAGMTSSARTPPRAYDGVHAFLRYQNDRHLYTVSVLRRDGEVVIKKKVPGGPSNGGDYSTLASAHYTMTERRWNHVVVHVANGDNAAVRLTLAINGRPLLAVTDTGAHGAPIASAGRIGIRADNTTFHFRHFQAISS